MAYYYIVEVMETPDGGITAAVPEGIAWVGQPHTDRTYLVKTVVAVPPNAVQGRINPIPEGLIEACRGRGLIVDEVLHVWAIGGEA